VRSEEFRKTHLSQARLTGGAVMVDEVDDMEASGGEMMLGCSGPGSRQQHAADGVQHGRRGRAGSNRTGGDRSEWDGARAVAR
jgi:hypothetical protein